MSNSHDHSGEAPARARASITACIIARDEAERLPACLASVAFCDEVVVVDSGSIDRTVQIARDAGAQVVEQPWLGFAAQRNVALDHAHGDWVIEVDADERVSPELRAEIESFLADPPEGVQLGGLPLRDLLLGHALGASAKYPKYRHRLLARGAYRHDERRTVHEGLIPVGPVHPFTGDLLHLFAESWREALADTWSYARLEAQQLKAPRSMRAVAMGAFVRPGLKFLYRLSVDGGWRDGLHGAARIGLDCAGDSIVWLRHAAGRRGRQDAACVSASAHFGTRKRHEGSVHVLGIAAGSGAASAAGKWLRRAGGEGMDVALIADVPLEQLSVRVRRLRRMGPLQLLRALEAEQQLRSVDVAIPFGRRAGALLRVMPASLHGIVVDVSERDSPAVVAARTLERRRALAGEGSPSSQVGSAQAP